MIGPTPSPDPKAARQRRALSWWAYLGVALMVLGVIVALRINSRTATHIEEDRAAARDVRAMATRIEDVESEVHYLREFVRRVEAEAAAEAAENNERIRQIEAKVPPEANEGNENSAPEANNPGAPR